MYIFLAILYAIVGIVAFWRLIKKNKKNGIIGAYSGLAFGMILYYIVVPILTMLNLEELSQQYPMVEKFIEDKEMINYIYVLFLVIISFTFLELGYEFRIKRKHTEEIEKETQENKLKKQKVLKSVLKIAAWGTLIIGSVCLLIFFNALGGIGEALKYANTARTFYTSLTKKMPNYIAILIIPARLVTVAPFLFLWLDSIKDKHIKKEKYLYKLFASISLVFAILFFLYNAGKMPLICFLLSFFVAFCYKYTKKIWLILIPLAIVGLPMIDVLDELFAFFQKGTWGKIEVNYLKYLNQFIYPFRTLLNLPQINIEYGLRLGSDFITAFLNLIPGFQFPVSYENISLFFGGEEWRIKGGVPSDLITFFYTQFSLIGVQFLFIILGFILRKIDEALKKLPNKYGTNLIQAIIAIQMFSLVASADFEAVLRGQFILIILSVILIIANHSSKGKRKKKKRGEKDENIICNSNTTGI